MVVPISAFYIYIYIYMRVSLTFVPDFSDHWCLMGIFVKLVAWIHSWLILNGSQLLVW